MRRLLIVIATLALVAGACGSSADADQMVSFEARWMCDVQRSVYAEVSDLDAAFQGRLADNGLTADEYEAFKSDLADDLDLREQVLAEFDTYCG